MYVCIYIFIACPARLYPICVRSEALHGYSLPPIVSHISVVFPYSTQEEEDEANLSFLLVQFEPTPIVLARNDLPLCIDDNRIRLNKTNSSKELLINIQKFLSDCCKAPNHVLALKV